ncbi:MAG: phosphoglycerate mutase family protein [Pseudomonadota bacterium]
MSGSFARMSTMALLLCWTLVAQGFSPSDGSNEASQHGNERTALTEQPVPSAAALTTVVFLRHAEKAHEPIDDPALTDVGVQRARYWQSVLRDLEIERVFSTDTTRTRQTARIVSEPRSLSLELYAPRSFNAQQWIDRIRGQIVLVIGHSNTIPDMVNQLIGESRYPLIGESRYPLIEEQDYDRLYWVTIDSSGQIYATMLTIERPDTP